MKALPAEGNYFNQVNPNVYNEWVSGTGFVFHSMMRDFIRYDRMRINKLIDFHVTKYIFLNYFIGCTSPIWDYATRATI